MTDENALVWGWRGFVWALHDVDESVSVDSEKSEDVLATRNRHFLHIFTQLNARSGTHFHELYTTTTTRLLKSTHVLLRFLMMYFEDAAESWLFLTRDQMCSDAKAVDRVTLIKDNRNVKYRCLLCNVVNRAIYFMVSQIDAGIF